MFDVVIIGSGAAGVAAGEALGGRNVAMVDVGTEAPASPRLDAPFYEARQTREDLSEELLGRDFESLQGLAGSELTAKLKGPLLSFVTRDWRSLSPVESSSFVSVMSFARGGLANAWGAGVYRFDDAEFEDFPLNREDLEPYYDRLTAMIGVCGCDDDLTRFFGSCDGLQPPLELDEQGQFLLGRYRRRKRRLNARGIYIGRPRLAVLSRDHGERAAYDYRGLEFYQPNLPAIYNPSYTLADLIDSNSVQYLPNRLGLRWQESGDAVRLHMRNLANDQMEEIDCQRLLLAAGALNSGKLALVSSNDRTSRLPVLDNPISFTPMLAPRLLGRAQERRFFSGVQLNIVYGGEGALDRVQGSFYGVSGILRSDVLMDLPLTAPSSVRGARYLSSGLAIVQLFYPDVPSASNYLKLGKGDRLEIHYAAKQLGTVERELIQIFRGLGYLGAPFLCQYPRAGSCFHYGGTLPMREKPKSPYETWPSGLLAGTKNVYACDSATFPSLHSKSPTFTLMANSMRIAEGVAAGLRQ